MKAESSLISNFWWLTKNVNIEDILVGVGHHKEVTDSEEVPPLDRWYRSLDQVGNLSNNIELYPIHFLSDWRKVCKNTNVYRTLKVFDHNMGEAIFLGPFLVDIDNSDENLDDAQAITKQLVTYAVKQLKLPSDDMRIFFSGHKGFNIEIRPQAMGINGTILDQIKLSSKKLDEIISVLRKNNNIKDSYQEIVDSQGRVIARRHTTPQNEVSNQGTVVDRIYGDRFGYKLKHPYTRLHHSTNKWIRKDGSEIARMKIELTAEQLLDMSAAEISSKAEELAQMTQST